MESDGGAGLRAMVGEYGFEELALQLDEIAKSQHGKSAYIEALSRAANDLLSSPAPALEKVEEFLRHAEAQAGGIPPAAAVQLLARANSDDAATAAARLARAEEAARNLIAEEEATGGTFFLCIVMELFVYGAIVKLSFLLPITIIFIVL